MTSMSEEAALPPMWTENIDQRTGEIYYYNVFTAERTTKRPHRKAYDRKPTKGSVDGTTTGEVRKPYAYYTHEYKLQKYRKMDNEEMDKSRSKSNRMYKDYHYDDDYDYDNDDSYGVIIDSYSSDESDRQRLHMERSTSTTERTSSSRKYHRSSHKHSKSSKSKSKSKSSKQGRHTSRSHSPTRQHHPPQETLFTTPLRSKSMDAPHSQQQHDSHHRRKRKSHANSKSYDESNNTSKTKKDAKTLMQQLEEERRMLDEKKQKLEEKEKELQQQKEAMEQERKKQVEELKQKAAMEEQQRREAFETEEKMRRSLLLSETTRQAMKAEEIARQLEQRTQQLKEKEKELEEDRRSILEKLKREEDARQHQAALEEKARREAFEKEENRRLQKIRMQTKRQIQEAEEKAQKKAREAEEARRKAEEKAEEARQQAAALEMARLKAEQEAQLAKQKAALQEEARLQAVRAAQKAKQEANAKRIQQERDLKQAKRAAALAERKRIQAERKAHLEEQKRFKVDLKRQRMEESMAASYDDVEFYQDDSDHLPSSSSESVSLNDDTSSIHSMDEDRENSPGNQDSMERSIDIMDVFDDNSPNQSAQRASTARERKRALEVKYQSGHSSADTVKSSGLNDTSAGTTTLRGEKDLRSVPLRGQGEHQGKTGRRWFQLIAPREQAESGDRSGQDKASPAIDKAQGETAPEQASNDVAKSGRRWFGRSKAQEAEEIDTLARDDQSKEARPGMLRQSSRPGIERTSSDSNRPEMEQQASRLRQLSRPGIQRTSSDTKRPEMQRQGSRPGIERTTSSDKNRPGMFRQLKRPGIERTSSGSNRPEMKRQGSRPGIERTSSGSNRPEMTRQGSRPDIKRTSSGSNRPEMNRQGSRPGIERTPSRDKNRPGMFQQWSRPGIERTSSDTNRPEMERQGSKSGIQRSNSDSKQLERMASRSDPERRAVGPRSKSVDALRREDSTRPAMRRTKSSDFSNFNDSFQKPPPANKKKKRKLKYERPPRSLLVIWLLVAGKLGFDFGTTIISVQSLMEQDHCCGYEMVLGPIPMSITFPFFALVATELAMLIQTIMITVFPNIMDPQAGTPLDKFGHVIVRSTAMKSLCCCFRWNVRMFMRVMSYLIFLNPFFGCLIAWMLLYQSNKEGAFMVLGFEGGSLFLNYIAVCLEGSITGIFTFLQFGLLPLIPFAVTVGMVLFYLKQGGVCYIVAEEAFNFNGCEVCLNGYPPVNGTCTFANGTKYQFQHQSVFDLNNYNSVDKLENITSRTWQVSYCANENPGGPDTNFCFFDFEKGQLDGRVENGTISEIVNATNTTLKSNKCGGTVPTGEHISQCRQYLWNLLMDDSFHCLSLGGPGDPCQLNIQNDGENEGRFKDPSQCQPNRTFSDTFYLWDEPLAYGKDYAWAGNAWLAYSATRWIAQVEAMREMGVRVATPSVRYDTPEQVRDQFTEFFDACQPSCVTLDDPSYVDILALHVFCDPDEEFCDKKVEEVTGVLTDLSASFDSRPVHITGWGVLTYDGASKLQEAMKATDGFFEKGSPIERVYWWGGNGTDSTNLELPTGMAQNQFLADVWVDICKKHE